MAAIVLLLALVVVSALAVVYNSYINRQLFISLHALNEQYTQLRIEYGRLQLEQGSWASPAVIEQVAAKELRMQVPAPEQLVLVRINDGLDGDASPIKQAVANFVPGGEP